MNALHRFVRLGTRRQMLLLAALVALAWAKVQVRRLPFALIAARLGPMKPPLAAINALPAGPEQQRQARLIGWAVKTIARRLPFECTCLVMALAARALCRWSAIPATLHLGAQSGQTGAAETHAWLDASGVAIAGYPLPPNMVEIGCFPD